MKADVALLFEHDDARSVLPLEKSLRGRQPDDPATDHDNVDAIGHLTSTGMKVLVTGIDGYIGTLLGPYLLERGHDVTGVDTGFYRSASLYPETDRQPERLHRDIRDLDASDLDGFDAIVHMAELSNDPLGQLAPDVTYEINHEGSVYLARLAKTAGVSRFVYTSSCSVYGIATEDEVDEESPTNPQTEYATCKTLVERDVGAMADDGFSPTFLRNATVFGASPRMRFDLVLNNLAGLARTTGLIAMTSDGTPWRPLVHVLDVCKAIAITLDASSDAVHGEVLNVGDTAQNYQVREIAETVASVFTGCELTFGEPSGDTRSYRVSFEKIHKTLPEFSCEWNAERGTRELYELFDRIGLTEEEFLHRDYTRLEQLHHLITTNQLDEALRWRG
jgi:nucleoside-diphosphate-sugar epimerase